MTKQPKTTEPKLESLRKEDLIRMVRKQHKQIAKLQADTARLQSSNAVEAMRVTGKAAQVQSAVHRHHVSERDLTEAAFVAALDDLAQSGVPMQQRVVPPAFPWSTSALLPAVSPIEPEDK